MFLWRLPNQNHLKCSITEKRRNKTKYLTWNSIRLKFVKKTSMPNPVKSLGYIKCYSLSDPRSAKSPSNPIRYNCKKICRWSPRPKTILAIRKKCLTILLLPEKTKNKDNFVVTPIPILFMKDWVELIEGKARKGVELSMERSRAHCKLVEMKESFV